MAGTSLVEGAGRGELTSEDVDQQGRQRRWHELVWAVDQVGVTPPSLAERAQHDADFFRDLTDAASASVSPGSTPKPVTPLPAVAVMGTHTFVPITCAEPRPCRALVVFPGETRQADR